MSRADALRHNLRPLLIRASAGTGKTHTLANRYLALLAGGCDPRTILATTFTRKAAGEIQGRILQRLAQATRDEARCRELAAQLGFQQLTQAECLKWLVELVRNQHRLSICTLDSYCISIARSFNLELGLPADWSIVPGVIDEQMRRQAIERMLDEADESQLIEMLRMLRQGGLPRSVHEDIEGTIGELYELYQSMDEAAWSWYEPEIPPPASNEQVEKMIDGLATLAQNMEANPAGIDLRLVKAMVKTSEQLNARMWKEVMKGLAGRVADGNTDYYKKPIPGPALAILIEVAKAGRGQLLGGLKNQTLATHRLLKMFDEQYEPMKLRAGMLSFQDVKRLLGRAQAWEDLQELYFRLDGKIDHLLLDEFQDTSPREWRIFHPLADELLAGSERPRSFFCVGDPKQAIYAWRGGRSEIFQSISTRWPQVESETRSESWRCSGPVIEAVNRVFKNLGGTTALVSKPHLLPEAAIFSRDFPHHTARKSELAGHVTMSVPAEDQTLQQKDQPLMAAAELARRLSIQAPGRSIGVLVRGNKAVAKIIGKLRGIEPSVPVSEEGGNPLTDSPAVCAILSLLLAADHPADSVALFHVANSPLGRLLNFTDSADDSAASLLCLRVRRMLLDEGYGRTIGRWAQALAAQCDRRDLRRLLQLAELARLHDSQATLRPADFVRHVRQTRVEDPTSSPIRVMTIHQAKGLEFDIVILPELSPKLASPERLKVLLDQPPANSQELDPTGAVRYPNETLQTLDPRLRELAERNSSALLRESLCLLYVAMTRAIHALHIIVRRPSESQMNKGAWPIDASFEGLLRAALAPDGQAAREGGVIYEIGDPDWIAKSPSKLDSAGAERAADDGSSVALKLAPTDPAQPRMLGRQTPSSMEDGPGVNLDRMMRLQGREAATRGSILHAMLQQVGWLNEAKPGGAELAALLRDRFGMTSRPQIDALIAEFLAILDLPVVQRTLSIPAGLRAADVELWRERPFAVRAGDGILTGIFDRVELQGRATKPDRARIIDYKTDRFDEKNPEAEREVVDRYRPQLKAYRLALSKITGLGEKKIEASLLLVGAGRLIPLE